jgi:hypothetical protein
VDRNDFPSIKTTFHPPGQRRFLYIGNTAWVKNTGYLSRIARALPAHEFGWMGASHRPIAGFRAWGPQDFAQPESRRLLADYDFILTAGFSDANPTVVLEGMAWGLIPICTPQSGYEGYPGIPNIPLNDVAGACAVLTRLQEQDTATLLSLRHANDRLLDTHFTWERFARQVREALLEEGRAPLEAETDRAQTAPALGRRALTICPMASPRRGAETAGPLENCMNTNTPTESCRACGHPTAPYTTARVLNRHDVRYDRCPQCGLIQTETPHWLNEAYSEAIAGSDTGLLRRNFILAATTQSIIRSYFRPDGRFVDYGGGYGALVRLMRDAGHDFRRHDPMCANLFARGFDAAPPAQPDYELVTAFEVFEHLVQPREEMARMLAFSRNILFSTLLQPSAAPTPDTWWYYCLDTGQHVTLYTRAALEALGRAHGLRLVTDGKQLHLFTDQRIQPGGSP